MATFYIPFVRNSRKGKAIVLIKQMNICLGVKIREGGSVK